MGTQVYSSYHSCDLERYSRSVCMHMRGDIFMLLLVRKKNRKNATLPLVVFAHCIYVLSKRTEFQFIKLISLFYIGWIICDIDTSSVTKYFGRNLREIRINQKKYDNMYKYKEHRE